MGIFRLALPLLCLLMWLLPLQQAAQLPLDEVVLHGVYAPAHPYQATYTFYHTGDFERKGDLAPDTGIRFLGRGTYEIDEGVLVLHFGNSEGLAPGGDERLEAAHVERYAFTLLEQSGSEATRFALDLGSDVLQRMSSCGAAYPDCWERVGKMDR